MPSFEHSATTANNVQAGILAAALDEATERLLVENRSPARALGQIDNRGSHAYLAQYWAQALADRTDDRALAARFGPLAAELTRSQDEIQAELIAVQGHPVDIGGYYRPDRQKAEAVMRPSPTLNRIIAEFPGAAQ